MHPKLEKINSLLESGYDCVDIRSDHGEIEVVLAHDEHLLTLTLDRREAQELLLMSGNPSVVAYAMPERKKSFLVRGPVR